MKQNLKNFIRLFGAPNKRALIQAVWRSLRSSSGSGFSKKNLSAAYHWLCSAQDATPDDGVAAWYDLLRGWLASYPETTGYIIPTFLTYATVMNELEAQDRAIRMADWEIDVQLPSGAVRSGSLTAKVGPAVFNTGQVIFGWIAAYKANAEMRFAEAAQSAARWLVKKQDDDGVWRKNLSLMTSSNVQTYNTRTAWGLALAGHVLNERLWVEAARKNCDWALGQQNENGWFSHNSFSDYEHPLLHTIGYALEGLVGMGELLGDEKYLLAARAGVNPLVDIYKKTGTLKGIYDGRWKSPVKWRCLTGEAQIALVLHRLSKYCTKDNGYAELGRAILENLARVQDIESGFRETFGGLAGSEPIWGGYCSFIYPNWAVKFYMDALLLHLYESEVQ